MRHSSKIVGLAVLWAASSLFPACASRQRVEEVEAQVVEDFDCISESWANPPPQIGQTPPDDFPTAVDVDPFLDQRPQFAPAPESLAE